MHRSDDMDERKGKKSIFMFVAASLVSNKMCVFNANHHEHLLAAASEGVSVIAWKIDIHRYSPRC